MLAIWFRYRSIRNSEITVEINEELSARRGELMAATRTADAQLEHVAVSLENANVRNYLTTRCRLITISHHTKQTFLRKRACFKAGVDR